MPMMSGVAVGEVVVWSLPYDQLVGLSGKDFDGVEALFVCDGCAESDVLQNIIQGS